ncbi:hypothetical protein Tco_0379727 [Tanacetum coccineum]
MKSRDFNKDLKKLSTKHGIDLMIYLELFHITAIVAKVNSSTPGISPDVVALTTEVSELKNMMKTMLIDKQKAQAPEPVKAVEQSVSRTDFETYVKANDAVLKNVQNQGQNLQNQMTNLTDLFTNFIKSNTASTSSTGTLPSQYVTNPRQQINAITTRSGKTLEESSTPLFPTPVVSTPQKENKPNPETLTENVQSPNLENTAQVPPPREEEDSTFIETPKPKAKKTVNKLEEIAITTVNAECSAIIMNKVPKKLEDPGKFLIPCALKDLKRTIGNDELVYYADKSEKNKEKHYVHVISVIDFSKDDPFSGSTTTHSDNPSPSSSLMKTSENFEKFADELAPLDSLPPGNDDSTFKDVLHEENFQVYSNPLFEFDDTFKSNSINLLFDEMENVEIENTNVSNEPVLPQTPLSNKDECFDPGDDSDEIEEFLF